MDMESRLAQMSTEWKNKKDIPSGVPAGRYKAQTQNLTLAESSTQKMMLKREFLILEGEHEGTTVYDQIVIETDFGWRQLRQYFEQMGYTAPDEPTEWPGVIEAIIQEATGKLLTITVKIRNEFSNVTVNSVEDMEAAPAPVKKAPPVKQANGKVVSTAAHTAAVKKVADAGLQKGSQVHYKDSENDFSGTLTEIKGDGNALVETTEGDVYEVSFDDLKPVASEAVVEAPEDKVADLLAFSVAHGIEATDSMTEEQLVELIGAYEFNRSELIAEEVALLESINHATWAEAPKPKVATPKPATPKPATPKPAVKPPAKKPAPAPAKKTPAKKK